ncbi:preprotein translocase subunit SecE [Coriobacteriia bacterium Es71-Z0120]|uniref:preprotein translocase subunit SecE n=1 Tax=Parvivirga hydrogeniphila TaxID=2939460 RepID=UPI0022608B57|nr:preprotein translocase subunit SecE [Parvivirga hydrogeniphila]MCL4078522.1 preprotein translocase subunit SecE [Parvivirga hydrogeniphila]
MAQNGTKDKPNIFARIGKYFRDVRQEMKRVVWPSREEVINSSIVVVVTLLFFIGFTLVIDSISSWLFIDVLAKVGR